MKFRWSIMPPHALLAGELARGLQLTPLLAQCLINRGQDAADLVRAFLEPRLKHLRDPFLLPDMGRAIDRLLQAREKSESMVIFGDYDVDGVTSTALLLEVLRALGWKVEYYLPHRLEEGYGLSREGVENCLRKFPASLLLAVDCGSNAVLPIGELRKMGVDVIVVDHHQVSDPAPEAVAVVNPQRAVQKGPELAEASAQVGSLEMTGRGECERRGVADDFRQLCSVGLAFKLAHALVKRGREIGLPGAAEYDLRPLLDLVALGTIADVVPLTGENRILVSAGLRRLNTTMRPGLVALKRVAQCSRALDVQGVGFQLAPRLNAAGRLETAEESMQLLRARSVEEAMPIAVRLEAQNRERQKIERSMAQEAISAVQAKFKPESDFVIVEGCPPWHIGVVGIVASRVLQEFYRPTIIVGADGEYWRGSGRSIPGFDLAAALRECSDLLVRHGGHALAAGVTLATANLDPFRTRLNELARRALATEKMQPTLRLDAEVGLDEITLHSVGAFARFNPVGQGNPTVQFCARRLTHLRPLQRIGSEKQHVKMWVTDGTATQEAVWWGAGQESLPVGTFDLAFAPMINEYDGFRSVQLKVLDWRAAT